VGLDGAHNVREPQNSIPITRTLMLASILGFWWPCQAVWPAGETLPQLLTGRKHKLKKMGFKHQRVAERHP
jgi:hypothetical protein